MIHPIRMIQCLAPYQLGSKLSVLALAMATISLPACAPRSQKSGFVKDFALKSATPISNGARGNFRVSSDVDASNVKASDFFTLGCSSIGSDQSIAQIDSRLSDGDETTETFEDSGLNGFRRQFTKRERVSSFPAGASQIKIVGRVSAIDLATEYTKLCTTTPATETTPQSVNCTLSPSATVIKATDESEPCTFVSSNDTQTTRTRGAYAPPESNATSSFNAYQVQISEHGTLACGTQSFSNVTHTVNEVVSNEVPTFENTLCGGTVTYRFVTYKDATGKTLYNSRKEVKFSSRFRRASSI